MLDDLLRRDGLQILQARSGHRALELLGQHEVSLALVDVEMPGMTGFELAERMRRAERTAHIPIIFITGSVDRDRVFQGYESGAVDFLLKPIDPVILLSKAGVFFDLARQHQQLAESLRLNEIFVGILGHDLRNPLSAMLMGAQLLQGELSDERHLRTIRRMVAAGTRMRNMIEQLLDLTRARVSGEGLVCALEPVDVRALVKQCIDELRTVHGEREISVQCEVKAVTSGDTDRLLQLFSNLLGNAIHHGTAGAPIVVKIDLEPTEVRVSITNRGTIPAEILPTMFDPFRGAKRKTSKHQGLGLGLYIAERIAAAHGGALHAESSSERDTTTFTAHIPRIAPATEPAMIGAGNAVIDGESFYGLVRDPRDPREEGGTRADAVFLSPTNPSSSQ